MHIFYLITTDETLSAHRDEFEAKVQSVLTDSRGWKKYGFEFVNSASAQPCLRIELRPRSDTGVLCGTESLSCYRSGDHRVIINYANWMGNSQMSKDGGMSLDDYRTYVINHEVGHSLSLEHPKFYDATRRYTGDLATVFPPGYTQCNPALRGSKGSVMMQMSRGVDFIAPCKPNCWPLDPDRYDEFATHRPRTNWGVLFIMLLVIVVLVVLCISAHSAVVNPLHSVVHNLA